MKCPQSTIPHPLKSRMLRRRQSYSTGATLAAAARDCSGVGAAFVTEQPAAADRVGYGRLHRVGGPAGPRVSERDICDALYEHGPMDARPITLPEVRPSRKYSQQPALFGVINGRSGAR
ncbi:MAG: hypothetical protein JWP63_626 [Candidatus Solibacter sp.]|nr:hypothetical protein [Candidatus Solibacter sp.]